MVAPRATREQLAGDLRERAFTLGAEETAVQRIGIEVEFLPMLIGSERLAPLDGEGVTTLGFLRSLAETLGWRESVSEAGAPSFAPLEGGAVTVEPGGQLEYSSEPRCSIPELLSGVGSVVKGLSRVAREAGIHLLARGIDPVNGLEHAALQVRSERYLRMARHFDRYGSAGRRMMRQTAAIHVNLDLGQLPLTRWRMANALVPSTTAIFANSPRYQGEETGHRSFRARQWRELDPLRVGLTEQSGDPVESYLGFALAAPAIFLGHEREPARPFGAWLTGPGVDFTAWRRHLTTLFPEVRPRGYLEIRAIDALHPRWYAAPLVFLAGLLYDNEAMEIAHALVAPPNQSELAEAGRLGLTDPNRAEICRRLFRVALEGAQRLDDFVGPEALEAAREFYERFTARGRDPGHDPDPDEESSAWSA